MADALFDTTVVIDHYNGYSGAVSLFDSVIRGDLSVGYSPISTLELWVGITTTQEEIDYSGMISLLEELPVTSAVARIASSWMRGLSPRRTDLLLRDVLIAATAVHYKLTLYTRNVRDFRRLHSDVRSY